jgi:hypothetical protein
MNYLINLSNLESASRIQHKMITLCAELSTLFPELDSLNNDEINIILRIKLGLETVIREFNERVFMRNIPVSYLSHSDVIEALHNLLTETNSLLKELESLMGKEYN